MTENTEALRLRMVEPLDMDEAARTLTRAGLLVPLTDWSARERRFDIHPRWLGILTALLVPVGIAGWASLPTSSVSTPAAVGAGVAAFVLGIALEAWIVTHHPPVPETPAQVLSDVFGVDAALKDGARPFHREGFTRLTVRDGDGLAQATLFVRHITAPDGQRTACVALFVLVPLRANRRIRVRSSKAMTPMPGVSASLFAAQWSTSRMNRSSLLPIAFKRRWALRVPFSCNVLLSYA